MVSPYCLFDIRAVLKNGIIPHKFIGFFPFCWFIFCIQSEKKKGLQYLYTQVHNFPDKPLLRKVLANYLLNHTEKNQKHSTAATCMVQATIVMQRTHSNRYLKPQIRTHTFQSLRSAPKIVIKFIDLFYFFLYSEMTSMDVAKLLVLASEAMRCMNPVKSKHLVQKAIHANPLCREAWTAKQLLYS